MTAPGPGFDFAFEDGELGRVLEGGPPPVDGPQEGGRVAASDELTALTRRIAGQYAEVIASFAARAFAGQCGDAAYDEARAAVHALKRLSSASDDAPVAEVLDRFAVLVSAKPAPGARARQRFATGLHELLLELAQHLEPGDAERLRKVVTFDRHTVPLLDELAKVPGIGRRRLERLYAAGLFTVEIVCASDPDDIAAVTNIPRPLARTIVDEAQRFAERQRVRVVTDIEAQAVRVRDVLATLPPDDPARQKQLAERIGRALHELQQALSRLSDGGPS